MPNEAGEVMAVKSLLHCKSALIRQFRFTGVRHSFSHFVGLDLEVQTDLCGLDSHKIFLEVSAVVCL